MLSNSEEKGTNIINNICNHLTFVIGTQKEGRETSSFFYIIDLLWHINKIFQSNDLMCFIGFGKFRIILKIIKYVLAFF